MPNPASVSCGQAGGTVEIKKDTSGDEYGMCTFRNGTSCEEWALFRGEGCKPGITMTPTAEGKKMFTFTEADNGKTGDITREHAVRCCACRKSHHRVHVECNPVTGS